MSSKQPVVTKADITAGLRRVGIARGEVVFVHSSLSAFGWVEGGADAVIDALLDVVGPEGTVVMPAFTWRKFHAITEPVVFDLAHESVQDEVGIIPESFRLRPEALRSTHLCHSVSAIGPHAREVLSDGVKSFGRGSTFARLEALDAWYLFLGATMGSCTAMHHVEDLMQVPYRYYREFKGTAVLLPDGTRQPCRSVEFLPQPGVRQDLQKMERVFAENGVLRTTQIGNAKIINLRLRDLVRVGLQCLEQDIEFLLK
ncbi:MAG TPA: AAC(3) family N-acetyltransferase [Caldilineae bacterium]|nr:AAC(3) family N-acetyltransferase [Caldilineae bacterium]